MNYFTLLSVSDTHYQRCKTITKSLTKRAYVFLFLLLPLCVQAQNLTLNLKNVTVKEAIDAIKAKSGYSFFFEVGDLNTKNLVSINISNKPISEALDQLLINQHVSYTIKGKHIIISKPANKTTNAGKVTGTIKDEKGEPVIAATVSVKGSSQKTASDINGAFAIDAPAGAVLIISCIGYAPQEVALQNRLNIEITLKEDNKMLDDIVVVGYGTQRKSDLTGSISQVKMSDMQNKQAVSLADYLRGSVAGLNISRSSSVTGSQSFEIRGATSIGANTQPLLVVDGMIFQGLLNDINPTDIETIDVLKDASSTAIYGSRAASGVIIITTKQGKTDKPTINFDVKHSLSSLLQREAAYDVDGYLNMRSDAMASKYDTHSGQAEYYKDPRKLQSVDVKTWLQYDGAGVPADANPMDYWLQRLNLYSGEVANYNAGKSVDWLNEVFRTGVMKDYNASISGKTNNLNYYWSVGMLDNKGVVYKDDYRNIRTRINVTSDITSFLQTGMRANFSTTSQDSRPADWASAYQASPLGDLYSESGHYTRYPNTDIMGKHPLDKTQYDVLDRNQNAIGTLFAKLKLPLNIVYELNYSNRWRWKSGYTYKPSYTIDALSVQGSASREEYQQYDWSLDNIVRWEETFAKKHRFNVTLLYNASKWLSKQSNSNASDFSLSEILTYHGIGMGGTPSVSSEDQEDTRASMMARLNYSFNNRYLLTASFRRDGYSAFGQANPWANFPSVALAWRVNEEPFMKPLTWISNTKLRLSYGLSGNSGIGRYAALSRLSDGNYVRDGQTIISLYPTSMANQNLKWEQTAAFNAGLDLGFLNSRINATLEWYYMTTKDMLLPRTLPTLTGFTSIMSNMGQLDNKGFELTIDASPVRNSKFKWNSDFTFSFNRNKIVHLYGDMEDILDKDGKVIGRREVDDPTNGRYIGQALDAIYGYHIVGVWQTEEKDKAAKYGRVPGDYKTLDKNDDNKLDPSDYEWQGYTKPRFRFSQRNSFTLNNAFDFSFLVRANVGHKRKLNNDAISSSYSDRISQMVYPYWTPTNRSNSWGRLSANKTGDIYLNGSFIRIDDFSVGYKFNPKLLKKLQIQNARIYLTVDNIWSFDNWVNWDVETGAPTPCTFTSGISLTL